MVCKVRRSVAHRRRGREELRNQDGEWLGGELREGVACRGGSRGRGFGRGRGSLNSAAERIRGGALGGG